VFVWLASFAILAELAHPNIHIHRFTGGFLHQKALLVDDAFAAIGTANFDNRSFRLNFEITLAVSGPRFASEVARMFESYFAESVEVGRDDYESRPLYFKASRRRVCCADLVTGFPRRRRVLLCSIVHCSKKLLTFLRSTV
jgi:cardiolipin synthase